MKLIVLILSIFLSFNCENTDPLDVEIYTLENGLTVMLNEDHNETSVFGAVVLDAGGKRDPSDATGIAHYLEHVLFKGTSELGTTDYEKEKIFLDSIAVLYDELALKKSDKERLSIQKHINKLSIKASEYAIPNEFTRLVEGMGGTGLNAGTSYDFVYYFNSLPSAQIEKWIDLYSHRFTEPVFRLFQSELETVYEEKNRAMDNPFRVFNETSRKYFFKNHPYGQQTILGSVEHLKTPSLSKMKEFYDKYYVPNNMSLIIAGDFDKGSVKKMIKNKFGRLKKGASIEKINVQEDDFNGREVVDLSITPYRIGRLCYRTVEPNHKDAVVLDLISNVFSNSSRTGLLDKLNNENKILGSYATTGLGGTDHGGFGFGFVPKDDSQSFDEAENLILEEIKKVKSGDFSDDKGVLPIAPVLAQATFRSISESIRDTGDTVQLTLGDGDAVLDIVNILNSDEAVAKVRVGGAVRSRMGFTAKGVELDVEVFTEKDKKDLEEAYKVIKFLRSKINEVNLLNAKLMYVNKVFKANNLSESQKVNIIAAFDKAETVKEVKLVFETVSDSVVDKKATKVNESKLGMASKPTGTTATKPEVISEVSDAVKRMQKLAGII